MSHRREGASAHRTGSHNRRLRVLVGTPWPDGISVEVEETPPEEPRVELVPLVFGAFAVLLTAFTAYAMATANQAMLDDVFRLVQYGVVASVSYALGRHPPRSGTLPDTS